MLTKVSNHYYLDCYWMLPWLKMLCIIDVGYKKVVEIASYCWGEVIKATIDPHIHNTKQYS